MADLESQITGLAELQKLLERLPADIERKVMRGALRAGMKVVLNDAKQVLEGHNHTEHLVDSLRVKTRARGGTVTAALQAGGGNAFYAHMVEFGTAAHLVSVSEGETPIRMTRRGPKPMSMKLINRLVARGSLKIGTHFVGPVVHHPGAKQVPFMRSALDAAASDNSPALEAVKAYLAVRIDKELAKLPDESDGETR